MRLQCCVRVFVCARQGTIELRAVCTLPDASCFHLRHSRGANTAGKTRWFGRSEWPISQSTSANDSAPPGERRGVEQTDAECTRKSTTQPALTPSVGNSRATGRPSAKSAASANAKPAVLTSAGVRLNGGIETGSGCHVAATARFTFFLHNRPFTSNP